MENKELKSNDYYSLSELFSTPNRRIIIPDFQRDYCWGDKTHGENNIDIVNGFLETLIDEYEDSKDSNVLLGKIDVYEHPKNHIYLTDGQQRLTTLYLLIGMLYRREQNEEMKSQLKQCLISDFEENDEREPYLQYAVRESTVFFLRDLVNEFFIETNSIKVSDIPNQPWYFSDYDLDPSIISMLLALSIIEDKSKEFKDGFSIFVINKIKIQYYDVQSKKQGEERFVIINTTGKSLTVSENIKPILLGGINDFPKEWEERETWFWKNKKEGEAVADNGVNDFLTWYFQIVDKQDSVEIIKKAKQLLKTKKNEAHLKKIQEYFEALQLLLKYLKEDRFQEQFMFINNETEVKNIVSIRELNKEDQQKNILLPLLAFIAKFGEDKEKTYQFLRRLRKNYFDLQWENRNGNYVDWRYVLQIIEKVNTVHDILTFSEQFEQIANLKLPETVWYNEEERQKDKFKTNNQKLIEKWEDDTDFMGDLSPLIAVVECRDDINEYREYYEIYTKINPNNFSFSKNIKLGNIYRLLTYLENGIFEHRAVSGWGYCMLVQSTKKIFLNKNFKYNWGKFRTSEEQEVLKIFEGKLREFFDNLVLRYYDNVISFDDLLTDTRIIGSYERVYLWAILEYLHIGEKEIIIFQKSIAQYWEYPNLIKIVHEDIESDQNDYSIDNLCLGTSYPYNKMGGLLYDSYPLMKSLKGSKESSEKIKDRICSRLKLLKNFLGMSED